MVPESRYEENVPRKECIAIDEIERKERRAPRPQRGGGDSGSKKKKEMIT